MYAVFMTWSYMLLLAQQNFLTYKGEKLNNNKTVKSVTFYTSINCKVFWYVDRNAEKCPIILVAHHFFSGGGWGSGVEGVCSCLASQILDHIWSGVAHPILSDQTIHWDQSNHKEHKDLHISGLDGWLPYRETHPICIIPTECDYKTDESKKGKQMQVFH